MVTFESVMLVKGVNVRDFEEAPYWPSRGQVKAIARIELSLTVISHGMFQSTSLVMSLEACFSCRVVRCDTVGWWLPCFWLCQNSRREFWGRRTRRAVDTGY